jgi:hypothetical protein
MSPGTGFAVETSQGSGSLFTFKQDGEKLTGRYKGHSAKPTRRHCERECGWVSFKVTGQIKQPLPTRERWIRALAKGQQFPRLAQARGPQNGNGSYESGDL